MDQSGGRGWQNKSKNIDRDDKTGKIVNSKRKIERIKAGEGVAEQTIKAKLTSGVNISLFSCEGRRKKAKSGTEEKSKRGILLFSH